MQKIALITGITGQDGSYLSELLLKKNYKVHGFVRPNYNKNNLKSNWRIKKFKRKIFFYKVHILDEEKIKKLILKIRPDEIYHLAAQSYVDYFKKVKKNNTFDINFRFTKTILQVIKKNNIHTRFFFAGSSEMYSNKIKSKINENCRFSPSSNYGLAKLKSYKLLKTLRKKYGIHASMGILFNHESPRKDTSFVLRKISSSVAQIKYGFKKKIKLGDIKSKRDWGHAKDFVKAMWLICQQKKPDDFIIGTGKIHSVEQFAKLAFNHVKLDYKKYIEIDKTLIRKGDSRPRVANITKIKKKLKWKPNITFNNLVKDMVDSDLKRYIKRY